MTSQLLYNGGKVENYFRKVKNFLDRHPNEVLTIIIANPGNVSAKVWQPIMESSGKHFFCLLSHEFQTKQESAIGLADIAYVPPQTPMMREDWPTLREMLDSGKRLVFFMDKGTDEGTVPYVLPEFKMVCTISPSLSPFLYLSCCASFFFYKGVGR